MPYDLQCQSCHVIGEVDEYMEEFECPQCSGTMLPLVEEEEEELNDYETPTISISLTEINEYKESLKVASVVNTGFGDVLASATAKTTTSIKRPQTPSEISAMAETVTAVPASADTPTQIKRASELLDTTTARVRLELAQLEREKLELEEVKIRTEMQREKDELDRERMEMHQTHAMQKMQLEENIKKANDELEKRANGKSSDDEGRLGLYVTMFTVFTAIFLAILFRNDILNAFEGQGTDSATPASTTAPATKPAVTQPDSAIAILSKAKIDSIISKFKKDLPSSTSTVERVEEKIEMTKGFMAKYKSNSHASQYIKMLSSSLYRQEIIKSAIEENGAAPKSLDNREFRALVSKLGKLRAMKPTSKSAKLALITKLKELEKKSCTTNKAIGLINTTRKMIDSLKSTL